MTKEASIIIDTIRKALRLASGASNKHEAETARKLAYELMEKHNLNIEHDDSENYREKIENVAGVFWREQLLNNIARAHSCKLLRVARGKDAYDAVLAGYASDVEKARNLFQSVQTKMIVDCCMRWQRFSNEELNNVARGWNYGLDDIDYSTYNDFDPPIYADGLLGGLGPSRVKAPSVSDRMEEAKRRAQSQIDRLDIVEKEIGNKSAFAAWARAYLDTASDEFGKALSAPKVKAPVYYDASPGFIPPRRDTSERDKEIAKITLDAKELAKKFGDQLAQRLQRDAVSYGKIFGSAAADVLKRPSFKRLTAASSWLPPPPPPSRFNSLDLDDREVVEVAPRVRKIELDIEDAPKKPQPRRGGRDLDLD